MILQYIILQYTAVVHLQYIAMLLTLLCSTAQVTKIGHLHKHGTSFALNFIERASVSNKVIRDECVVKRTTEYEK